MGLEPEFKYLVSCIGWGLLGPKGMPNRVNVMNEKTQQLQDITCILTSVELCRKRSVANKNEIITLQRSKVYDIECEKQRQLYKRYRDNYSRCKCEAVKCQRDKEKVKYQRLCKRKCQLYSNEQTEIWCDTKRKDHNYIGST